MKATGIVRRIDDLGRVVIPKEVRRAMHIKEGDPLEIYTCAEGIVFAPYQKPAELNARVAREWLNKNGSLFQKADARFSVAGTETTCEIIKNNTRVVGRARCNKSDEFDPAIGMIVAFCHATDMPIPLEFTEDF